MNPVLQKLATLCAKNRVERVQISISDEDLARIEMLAHVLNGNDDASLQLRCKIESILASQTAFGTEDRRAASFRMLTRH